MIKLSLLFKKTVLVALVAMLALAALPVTSVSASSLSDEGTPPADKPQLTDERLEQVWTRLNRIYQRQGHLLERADRLTEKLQGLIDRANENGKDTTALQAALDTFKDATKDAHPIYESAKGIIHSHQGFDDSGKLTDREKALVTVEELGAKLKEVRQLTGEPGKALREAVKAFREANRPAETSN